jgi:RHH-type proline utilization regulon transcriptional repressor/proline dehydrogenase/delta 1-pyrroline-5-carboxylate dehydrogenase
MPTRVMTEFVFASPPPSRDALRDAIARDWLADEAAMVARLADAALLVPEVAAAVQSTAVDWVRRVRARTDAGGPLDALMREYDLSSEEGVVLMCLAEALLRIPDAATAEKLIADKLGAADWASHLGHSESLFVNASTWGLLLGSRLLRQPAARADDLRDALGRFIARCGEPVVRLAIRQAMRFMGSHFVMGRDIGAALERTREQAQHGELHSFDMLGEAALTAADAERYFTAYRDAIAAIGAAAAPAVSVFLRPGISVKLSALHPRYELAQRGRVLVELVPRLLALAQAAGAAGIALTVDAEEAERLELSLDVFESVFRDRRLSGWDGFGLAVQAYQKRAPAVIDWLAALARTHGRRLPVRLVKGAYWDSEIKRAQEQGLAGYPVYTHKSHTDVAYLACARRLLAARDAFYPQFATHNAHTLAAIRAYAGLAGAADGEYELQRLHGMGEMLHAVVREDCALHTRVYAPVGSHEDLLPYLVRRLLENGANTSFVHRIHDSSVAPERLVADPVVAVRISAADARIHIPLPRDLYGNERRNSAGINLASSPELEELANALAAALPPEPATAASLLACDMHAQLSARAILNPADRRQLLGAWMPLSMPDVSTVMAAAQAAYADWNATPVEFRAHTLERAADTLEERRAEFMALLIREGGKTIPDALAEVREAADFLRYYAAQARRLFASAQTLPGPTGEHNALQLHGRGVFVCISPWNFPLAIFTGQIAAALAAGNSVVAKPAEQTNLVALRMSQLLHAAGVPRAVLQCVLGAGDIGAALVADARVAGVAFTGSVAVARAINRGLAAREGAIVPLIAETGGQNAMIVDSSALPEQVVRDAIHSAFHSAGQRCSALRVLCLQDDIAAHVISMLRGAMRERVVGDPALLATDIGPVIDEDACNALAAHAASLDARGAVVERLPLDAACVHGTFFAPMLAEIASIAELTEEHFGPILHVVRWRAEALDALIDAINATGYGLTLGVHSRIDSMWQRVAARARVGNVYVNRGMTGAVVGVQPFGGEGLSGTGPKAGGPHYLLRFASERTLTVNTAAVGGNAHLLAQ